MSGSRPDRITTYYIDGPADLVVEVVSEDTVELDQRVKLAEYEAAGVPEYWVVNPMQQEARFYQLGADGRYQLAGIGADGVYTSRTVSGLRLRPAWLWQRPLPSMKAALEDLPD